MRFETEGSRFARRRSDRHRSSESGDGGNVDHFNRWFAVIVVAGFILRIAYVYALRNRVVGVDGFGYIVSSARVADGDGFVAVFGSGPSASHPPAWTSFLALVRLAGLDSSVLALQVAAVGLGTAAVALTGVVARRIVSQRGALLAAGLAALYPGFWYYERELLSETLAVPAAAAVIGTAYRFVDRPSLSWAAALGSAGAVLALTRGEQMLLTAFLFAPLILLGRSINLRSRVLALSVAAAATVVVIAPWFVYNLGRFEQPVFLATGMGPAMAQGACPVVFSGPLLGFHDIRCLVQATVRLNDPSLDESQFDQPMREAALDYTSKNLDRLPIVLAAREGRTWGFYRPFQTAEFEADWAGSPVWVLHATTVMFWVLLVAAARGVFALRRRWQLLLPLLAPVVVVAITVALTFGQPRYRAPADVGIVLLAAVGIDAWTRRSRHDTASMGHTSSAEIDTAGGPARAATT